MLLNVILYQKVLLVFHPECNTFYILERLFQISYPKKYYYLIVLVFSQAKIDAFVETVFYGVLMCSIYYYSESPNAIISHI